MAMLRVHSPDTSYQGVDTMADEYVSVAEAADILGVHKQTIRRMIKRGSLAAVEVGYGDKTTYMIKRTDLENARLNPKGRPPKNQTIL